MSLPASGRRTAWLVNTAVIGVLAAAALASAQTPESSATPAAAPAKKAHAAATPAKADAGARSTSYSLGVSMGDQLHASGIAADTVNSTQLAQGVRDALSGKTSMTDADRTNIQKLIQGAVATQADVNHRAAAKFLAENGKKPDVVTTRADCSTGYSPRARAPSPSPPTKSP
jgi:hypothetical protein